MNSFTGPTLPHTALPAGLDLARDGDVLLVLKDDEANESKIRVSSTILSYASSTFATMLGPRFMEGQGHRTGDWPIAIPLPEDDYHAVRSLCEILHFKQPSWTDSDCTVACDCIFQLSVVVDKYQCASSIRLTSQALLSRFLDFRETTRLSATSMHELVTASYLLDQSRYFTLFTRRFAMDRYGFGFAHLRMNRAGPFLPLGVLCEMHLSLT